MMSDLNPRVVRRSLRALALAPVLVLPLVSAPALAAPPEAWPDTEPVGALDFLLVLLVFPLGLALVVAILAYVPSLTRGEKYTPGLAWRNENEWFGGPTEGLEAADKAEPQALEGQSDRGGASARW
ncbi:MAG TPA: hypothetical protein VLB29_04465 [Nocardioidaceae bacterium]|nr:hypothetical protein [Nocardioidaceae bacterium]